MVASCAFPAMVNIQVCVGVGNWVDTYLCPVHMNKRGHEFLTKVHDKVHRGGSKVLQSSVLQPDNLSQAGDVHTPQVFNPRLP